MSILCDYEIEELCEVVKVLRLKFNFDVQNGFDKSIYIGLNKNEHQKIIYCLSKHDSIDDFYKEYHSIFSPLEHKLNVPPLWNDFALEDVNFDNISKLINKPMIFPFVNHSVNRNKQNEKILSYGLSSFGYDFRIAPEFKIFTNINNTIVDPKAFDENAFVNFEGDVCIIPPNSFVLARTVEMFHMPDDVVGICVGKSTIARVGINCLVTPVEPGWSGFLTLEFANTTPLPAKLYANEGGLQIEFFRGKRPRVTYSDRGGKYQNQSKEITLPKV